MNLFFFTWKGDTKIWLCTGGGRRLRFSSLSVRFGNFFFSLFRLQSRSHPPVENCAPIPKMVPHSLNEQKCIGEWVRGRVRALKSVGGEARRPPPPNHLPLLVLSRVLQPCNSVLRKKKKKNRDPTRSLDQVPGSTNVRSSGSRISVFLRLPLILEPTSLGVQYGRSALADPTRLTWVKKKSKKKIIKIKNNCTHKYPCGL